MFDPLRYVKTKPELDRGYQGILINDNYYTKQETTLSQAETIYWQSRGEISITAGWGGTQTVPININDFIGETYLTINMPLDASGNYKFPIGWGLAAIDSISYQFPSSNIDKQTISRSQIFSLLMGQNRDYTTTTLMMMLAGQGINYGTPITKNNRSARVLLPFPFSSMDPQVKPIDLTMFRNAPVMLTVNLAPAYQVYALRNAAPIITPSSIMMDWRQGHLSDQAFSLKNAITSDPTSAYGYPITKTTDFNVVYLPANQVMQVPINGFLDGDLLGLVIYVVENKKVPGTFSDDINLWELDPISDVEITFNSEVYYRARNFDYRLNNFQSVHSSGYDLSNTTFNGSVANFPVFVDFSMKRSAAFCDHYYNTPRFGGQTMQLRFTPSITTGTTYNVYICALYNEVLKQAVGSANIYLM